MPKSNIKDALQSWNQEESQQASKPASQHLTDEEVKKALNSTKKVKLVKELEPENDKIVKRTFRMEYSLAKKLKKYSAETGISEQEIAKKAISLFIDLSK
jgi:hypothetical protein